MKNLIKKLLFPIVISSQFLLPAFSFAKEKPEKKYKSNFYIGGSIGVYQGTEDMKNIYGNMLKLRGNIGLDLLKNFRLEGALFYITDERGPVLHINSYGVEDMEIKSKIGIAGFEALANFLIPVKWPVFRLGAGLTFMRTTEEVSLSPLSLEDSSETLKASANAVGPLFIFGIDVPINKEKTKNVYVEFSDRSAKFKWIFGDTLDMGGSSLDVGMRFYH